MWAVIVITRLIQVGGHCYNKVDTGGRSLL